MIFASTNEKGELRAFFDDRINVVPAGAFEISASVHTRWCADQHKLVWRGGGLFEVDLPEPAPAEPPSLEAVEARLRAVQAEMEAVHGQLAELRQLAD